MSDLILILAAIVVILFIIKKYSKNSPAPEEEKYMSLDDRYNSDRREREKEIDALLDKMGDNGINDLNTKDRNRLNELSKQTRNKH